MVLVVVIIVLDSLTESIIHYLRLYPLLQVLYTNGSSNDIRQSHCDPTALTTHHRHHDDDDEITTIRGKSLSPPNLRPNQRRQTISSVYYNRSHQRYLIRPFSTIRRQKLLAKAKQQAAARQSPLPSPLSPTYRTATNMGKTIAKTDLQTASAADGSVAVLKRQPTDNAGKPLATEDKGNSSDSEYSSLEDNDDDNNQGE